MKKNTLNILTLIFLASFYNGVAQTYSTGVITCDSNLSLELDVTSTEVTITINGLSDRWFAIGFGGTGSAGTGMNNEDVVYTTGPSTIDGYLTGYSAPTNDTVNDWTQTSNTVSGGIRTIVATRALNTGESNDYVFTHASGSINLIWAYGGSTTLNNHGGAGSRGATSATLSSLGISDFTLNDQFAIFPNPSNDFVNIKTNGFNISKVSIYDLQGRNIKNINFEDFNENTKVDLSDLDSGIYNLIIESSKGKGMKKVLIQ